MSRCARGCVVECRICNREVAGSNLGLGYFAPTFYSVTHPSGVGKWVRAAARKAKAGMAHSDCGWTCGCAGKTVKSLENTCHTWALLQWWFTTKRRYINWMYLYPLTTLYMLWKLLIGRAQPTFKPLWTANVPSQPIWSTFCQSRTSDKSCFVVIWKPKYLTLPITLFFALSVWVVVIWYKC